MPTLPRLRLEQKTQLEKNYNYFEKLNDIPFQHFKKSSYLSIWPLTQNLQKNCEPKKSIFTACFREKFVNFFWSLSQKSKYIEFKPCFWFPNKIGLIFKKTNYSLSRLRLLRRRQKTLRKLKLLKLLKYLAN